ncbi:MAG: peptidoglycan DD-metalloendopeptidase family protein [Nostocaceae cyanobacterium]|nr:peptidoglycan DD-metalloendopeptidase family protein [Nostocaceae cyanobacterium]
MTPFLVQATESTSVDTLKQQQQQIDKTRQNVTVEHDRLSNIQQQAESHLTGLQQNLQTTQSEIQDSEYRLQSANNRLTQLEADLVVAENTYQQHQSATIARLRFLQRSATRQGWTVLLQSQSLNDFLDRRRQLKLVYQADQKILAQLTKEGNIIKAQKNHVEEKKNEIALIREQLLAQKADFTAQAQSQQDLVQRLNSDRLALEAAQTQLDRDSQSLETLIQQKVAEAKVREEELAKTNSRKSIFVRGTGVMAYPSDAPTSSGFGWRMHPILGYRRFHAGLDFAAGYGTTIRAADSGTVIMAGWYGGYGKAVIIDHGKGITTLYGHTSELMISEGQTVQRGQAIAAVGSSGLSTGPHLHFEVRQNGTPVDPAGFL